MLGLLTSIYFLRMNNFSKHSKTHKPRAKREIINVEITKFAVYPNSFDSVRFEFFKQFLAYFLGAVHCLDSYY